MSAINNAMTSVSEAEQSFFQLCELEQFTVDKYTIKHNLGQWNMSIGSYKLKDGRIQIDVVTPFSEMNLRLTEKSQDPEFYNKNVAYLAIVEDNPDGTRNTSFSLNLETQYLIFNTPFFYPHNWFTGFNNGYLYTKVSHSINYLKYWTQAYKDMFQSGVPLIYIKSTRETRNHYEIEFILKEYLTLSYIKTDEPTMTVYFNLLVENSKKTQSDSKHQAKFHQISLRYPRLIKNNSNVNFKFIGNII